MAPTTASSKTNPHSAAILRLVLFVTICSLHSGSIQSLARANRPGQQVSPPSTTRLEYYYDAFAVSRGPDKGLRGVWEGQNDAGATRFRNGNERHSITIFSNTEMVLSVLP